MATLYYWYVEIKWKGRNKYIDMVFFLDGVFRILIEEVDESDVGIIKFPSFNGDSGMEEYR